MDANGRSQNQAAEFLNGPGEMAGIIRAFDWDDHPLGQPGTWSQALRTAIRLLLHTGHPMYVFWGAESYCFYNDAYSQIIGSERHPNSLGKLAKQVWQETWSIIGPQIHQVMEGGPATWHENALIPIMRNGKLEDVYWTYSYSPIDDSSSATGVGGVLVVCADTTAIVLRERRRAEDLKRQRAQFEAAPGFTCILTGPDHVFDFVNAGHRQLFNSASWVGKPVRQAFPDIEGQGFYELLDDVYRTGDRFVGNATAVQFRVGGDDARMEQRYLDFIYEPIKDEDGKTNGIFCQGFDVTERILAERTAAKANSRQTLLFELLNDYRSAESDTDIMAATDRRLGLHLGVQRVGFYTIENAEIVFQECWTDGSLSPLTGRWAPEKVGRQYSQCLRRGESVGVSDVVNNPLTKDSDYPSVGTRALIGGPVVRDGTWLGGLYVNSATVRAWEPDEVNLVREVADYAWDSIERIRSVTKLREREEQLRLASDAGNILLWVTETAEAPPPWSPKAKAMFGISPDAPTSIDDFYNGLYPEDREATIAAYRGAFDRMNGVYDVEYRTIGKEDGKIRWIAASGRGLFDDNGHCLKVLGAAVDITERKKYEAQLQDTNDYLEKRIEEIFEERKILGDVVEASNAFVQVIDQNYTLLAINKNTADAVERLFGIRLKAGDNLVEIVKQFPQYEESMRRQWGRALAGESYVEQRQFGEPEVRHYEARVSPLKDASGEIIGAFQFTYDITDRVRDQERLKEAEDQLRQAQKMEAVGQLTGGIAHDFNNMLAVVMGSLELLMRRICADDLKSRHYATAAYDGAKRAAVLTQRLLAFSRRQPLKPEPLQVNSMVAGMSELLTHALGSHIQLETVLAGGLWRVNADPNQLENVILNLGVNARDAMPDGGKLTIETQNAHLDERYSAREPGLTPGQYVLIAVTDTGVGMNQEVIAKAFDPFFTTKDVGKGTGLGLSQVYGFIKQSGGHIKIYSELGKGTTVKLYLPRFISEAEDEEPVSENAPIVPGEENEVVLVVDDEAAVRQFSVAAVGELGYRVIEADGAAAALKALALHPEISLLFTDIIMPETNGKKLAEAAREMRPDIKVLFTTGYTRNAVVHNGIVDHGVQLIGKPFTLNELAAKLRETLDG